MDDNYYPKMDEDESSPKKASDGEEDEGETCLVSKSMFGGKEYKPGDKCSFEIVHDHGDEVEVKHAPMEKEHEEESEMGKADGRLKAMAE